MVAAGHSPFSLNRLIGEAKRRMRRRRGLAAVAVLLAAGLAVGLAFAFRSPGGGPSAAPPTTSYSQPAAHLGVILPTSLHVTTKGWNIFSDPKPRLVLYSGQFPAVPDPSRGVMGPPRVGQVVGALLEVTPPVARGELRRFPARPDHFEATHLTQNIEGFTGKWQEIIFRDHGRAFYLFIGVGTGGSVLVPTLLHAFDTLRVGSYRPTA
jgi:hypothetical protein